MKRILLTIAAGATLATIPGAAQAQTAYDAQRFKPAVAQTVNYWGLHQARVLSHLQLEVGFFGDFAHNLLVLRRENERLASIVQNRFTGHILAGFGILDRLEIGLDVPLVLMQTGDEITLIPSLDASDAGFGLGDLRLNLKGLILSPEEGESGLGLAAGVDLYLPTGNQDTYQGESFRVEPRVALDYVISDRIRVGLNAGAMIRKHTVATDLDVDDTIRFGAAADFALLDDRSLHLIPEIQAETVLKTDNRGAEEFPLETVLGARWISDFGLYAQGGTGFALVKGFGVPDWRVFAGLGYTHTFEKKPVLDTDGDGLLDVDDDCVEIPEDLDGYLDRDGCVDPDDDNDGIPDTADSCRLEPEDVDGYQDQEGCPDPDNDGDGILDVSDACPMEPETLNGTEDTDGCPDTGPDDLDRDGVPDLTDQCPTSPEDRDSFEDENGCPDPDNDQDLILDVDDACPMVPEDMDSDSDADGCPEESGSVCVDINFSGRVQFETDSDEIKPESFAELNLAASTIKSNDVLKLIEVQGHTDNRGSDSYNEALSQRRAESVRRYLIEQGVDGDRLRAKGYGESEPVDRDETEAAWAKNRRVVFVVVERTDNCPVDPT